MQQREPYTPEETASVAEKYEAGLTQREIATLLGMHYRRVQRIMAHGNIKPRRAGRRYPMMGEENPLWKGDDAGIDALHARVKRRRGKALRCSRCHTDDAARHIQWANLTGNYTDPMDYAEMCSKCHIRFDTARRTETGKSTQEPYYALRCR